MDLDSSRGTCFTDQETNTEVLDSLSSVATDPDMDMLHVQVIQEARILEGSVLLSKVPLLWDNLPRSMAIFGGPSRHAASVSHSLETSYNGEEYVRYPSRKSKRGNCG